jgi:quercetin dioxygenase-like cupin family protein
MEHYDIRNANPYGEQVSTKVLSQTSGFKAVSVAIPAGEELREHTTPGPAMLFTLEGAGQFTAGGESVALASGTVVHIPAGVPHRIVATAASHFVLVR